MSGTPIPAKHAGRLAALWLATGRKRVVPAGLATVALVRSGGRTPVLIAVIVLTWLSFDALTSGLFLSPRNLYNLSVQSSVVAIMSAGMVFVIVSRNVDLSIGSVLGFTGMVAGLLAIDRGTGSAAAITTALVLGTAIGAGQGALVAYAGVPSFVVTLAGLLVFRGASFEMTQGRTVAPFSEAYQLIGGGLYGALGSTGSVVFGALAVTIIGAVVLASRRGRAEHGFVSGPWWQDGLKLAAAAGAIATFVGVTIALKSPATGLGRGIPLPVVILIAVVLATEVLARKTRFGRHVYAIGGSPEAAELSGIATKRVVTAVFALVGCLSALAAVVTTARLNAATNSLGTLAELSVIAASVIGGASLSGGRGTISGAVLGAVFMQSLETGLVLVGTTSSQRQIVIGVILVVAVWLDRAVANAQGSVSA